MKTVAIIGCGKFSEGKEGWAIGHAHAHGWKDAGFEVQLIGVDISSENLKSFQEQFDVPDEFLFESTDALYAKCIPDYVSICTWPKLHAPMAIEAAEKGVKGIALEKPVALNLAEMEEIQQASEKNETKIVVAHQRCYNTANREIKNLIAQGTLGEKVCVEARVSGGWDILSWSVHWLNLAEYLIGSPSTHVLAGMDLRGERRYDHAVESNSTIFVEYANGSQANFITGPDVPHMDNGLVITGSKGMIQCSGGEGSYRLWDEQGYREVDVPNEGGLSDFSMLVGDLNQAVENNKAPDLLSFEFASRATMLAYAAHESSRVRERIELPLATAFAPLEVADHNKPQYAIPEGKVLLVADDHFGSGGQEGIAKMFKAHYNQDVLLVNPESDFSEVLSEVGLVFVYHTAEKVHPAVEKALSTYVSEGKAMLVAHAGLGAWRNWDAFKSWIGRHWVWEGDDVSWHPHAEVLMKKYKDCSLPISWNCATLPKDECFVNLKEVSPCVDHLQTTITEGTFPVCWTSAEHPKVGMWMPGHRGDTWSVDGQIDGVLALIAHLS